MKDIYIHIILNDKYDIIDGNMSCSNVGARKGRNIRDHLFVINGILNEAANNKDKNIHIQIVVLGKYFDKMSFLTTDSKIDENMEERYNKGIGVANKLSVC